MGSENRDKRIQQRNKNKDTRTQLEIMLDPYNMAGIREDSTKKKGKGTFKQGYDIKDFDNISFNDYMKKKDSAANMGLGGRFLGLHSGLKDDIKYIEDNGMVTFDPNNKQDMEATYIKGNMNTVPFHDTNNLVQGKGMAGMGMYSPDNSRTIYRPEGYDVPPGYMQQGTYKTNMGGESSTRTARDNPTSVNVVQSPVFSGGQGTIKEPVSDRKLAPLTPPKYKQAPFSWGPGNSIDDNMAVSPLPADIAPNWGANPGFHKTRNDNGTQQKFWTADNDSGFWQTDAGVDKARETWGEGSLPSFVKQPKQQEIDIQGIKNWFSENWGK